MKFKNTKILLLALFMAWGIFQNAFTQSSRASTNAEIEHAILDHINAYRQKHGLKILKMEEHMVREARNHSLDMANHTMPFGHKYFKSRINRLHSVVKNSNAGAENVAYNYKDAADVVKNWLRSPGHKRNIDGNYDLTGVGIARDSSGKIYFTQIFLRTGAPKTTIRHYASRRIYSNLFPITRFKLWN